MVLYSALVCLMAAGHSSNPSMFQTEVVLRGSVPSAEQLGAIRFDEALSFSIKYLRMSYRVSVKPVPETRFQFSQRAFEIVRDADKVLFNFNGGSVCFHRKDGKFASGFIVSDAVEVPGDIGEEVARDLAKDYFHALEPVDGVEVKLIRKDRDNTYQIKIRRKVDDIPFADGLTCWIEPTTGRLTSSIYAPSYPIHSTSGVQVNRDQALASAGEALARYLPETSLALLPNATLLEYWPPSFKSPKETTAEQDQIGNARQAIAIYSVFAYDIRKFGLNEIPSRSLIVYVDARTGRAMAITDLPLHERARLRKEDAVKTNWPWNAGEVSVLSEGKWMKVASGKLEKAPDGSVSESPGKSVTVKVGSRLFQAWFDESRNLMWNKKGSVIWKATPNASLRAALVKAKVNRTTFGRQ